MDSVQWVVAASHVLGVAAAPMHISQLKQLILTQNLVPAGWDLFFSSKTCYQVVWASLMTLPQFL